MRVVFTMMMFFSTMPMFMFVSPASTASSPPIILRTLPFFVSAASSAVCTESGE